MEDEQALARHLTRLLQAEGFTVVHAATQRAAAACLEETPLDLALVSGSAIGHDIGKFGCHPGERVAYLHYYYTDLWFRRHRLTDIGHVAANHSVWDLEPEYLSAEALLLMLPSPLP